MQADSANKVYNKSSEVSAGDKAKPIQAPSAPIVVSAPTTVNKTNQQSVFKSPIRNQDDTVKSYYKSRFA
jgi:hypothetical protein